MEMISPDVVTDEEREMQHALDHHPALKRSVTLLLNSYRERITMLLDDEDRPDPSDIARSCAKSEMSMQHIGIPLLNTPEAWYAFFHEREGDQ